MSQRREPHTAISTEIVAWIGRLVLLVLLAACPWPYGMANWTHQTWLAPIALILLACAAFVAIRNRIRVFNPLMACLGFMVCLALLQTLPLPDGIWNALSPAAEFDANVTALAAELGTPVAEQSRDSQRTLSIHPLQTQASTHVFASAVCVLLSAFVLFRSWASVIALFAVLALTGFGEAALGLYQAIAAGNWRLLENMRTNSFATFISRNSAPQYFASALGATLGIMVLYRSSLKRSEDKRYQISYPSVNPIARLRRRVEELVSDVDPISATCLCGLVTILAAILVANSRGGILACVASGLIVMLVYASGKQATWAGSVGILLLMAGCAAFLSMFELDAIIGRRLDTLSEEAYKLDNPRFGLWQMALGQRSTWLLGSGLGTFHFAILPGYTAPQTSWFYHAENIFIEAMAEAGPLALVAAIIGAGWLLLRLFRRHESSSLGRALRLATLFPVAAICLQSIVDFSLILPGVFLPLAALVGSYLASAELPKKKKRRRSRSDAHGRSASEHSRTRRSSSHASRGPASSALGAASSSAASSSTVSSSTVSSSTVSSSTVSSRAAAELRASAQRSSRASTRESEASSASSSLKSAGSRVGALIQLLVIGTPLLLAIYLGWQPLAGFAAAEQMQIAMEASDTPPKPDAAWIENFPEVALQNGRGLQAHVQRDVFHNADWPTDITERMRQSLSRPEFFAAGFHQPEAEGELDALRELIEAEPSWSRDLKLSNQQMRLAAAACPLDWRANWGLLRSDLRQLDTAERNRNYARLLLGCRSNLGVVQAAASQAVISGDTQAGLAMWRELLPSSPTARARVVQLLDGYLTIEQLLSVFPQDPFMRISLAQQLSRSQQEDAVELTLRDIQLLSAFTPENRAREWLQIVWAAERRGEQELILDALKEATLDSVRDHALNHRYALALRDAGRDAEALTEINHALTLDPDNPTYQQLRAQLTTP